MLLRCTLALAARSFVRPSAPGEISSRQEDRNSDLVKAVAGRRSCCCIGSNDEGVTKALLRGVGIGRGVAGMLCTARSKPVLLEKGAIIMPGRAGRGVTSCPCICWVPGALRVDPGRKSSSAANGKVSMPPPPQLRASARLGVGSCHVVASCCNTQMTFSDCVPSSAV